MTKPIIAVDADDTLFDEHNAVRRFINETYGTSFTAEDYDVLGEHHNYWQNIWALGPDETEGRYEAFVTSSAKHNLEPKPGALSVLTKLKEKYDLVIVTARDHRAVDLTHASLVKHYPNTFSDVHFVPLWGGETEATKAQICLEIGATYLIDDAYHHCAMAAEVGIETLLFGDYGWNRGRELLSHMTRALNWQAVKEYFDAAK